MPLYKSKIKQNLTNGKKSKIIPTVKETKEKQFYADSAVDLDSPSSSYMSIGSNISELTLNSDFKIKMNVKEDIKDKNDLSRDVSFVKILPNNPKSQVEPERKTFTRRNSMTDKNNTKSITCVEPLPKISSQDLKILKNNVRYSENSKTYKLSTLNSKENKESKSGSKSAQEKCKTKERAIPKKSSKHQENHEIKNTNSKRANKAIIDYYMHESDVEIDPPKGLSHRERLEWLQKQRDVGVYVHCDTCNKLRYLKDTKDPTELPSLWFCHLNPDKNYNKCSTLEESFPPHVRLSFIDNLYNAGSVVWARVAGYPWWPAIVDDDPDTEQFYWTELYSSVPTWYHVTFFDKDTVTRAWCRTADIKKFIGNNPNSMTSKIYEKYKVRLQNAFKEANRATNLPLAERLAKFSFLARWSKPINAPKDVHKNKEAMSDSESDDAKEHKMGKQKSKQKKKKLCAADFVKKESKPKKAKLKSRYTRVMRTSSTSEESSDTEDTINNSQRYFKKVKRLLSLSQKSFESNEVTDTVLNRSAPIIVSSQREYFQHKQKLKKTNSFNSEETDFPFIPSFDVDGM